MAIKDTNPVMPDLIPAEDGIFDRHPVFLWIPAFAGMTIFVYLVTYVIIEYLSRVSNFKFDGFVKSRKNTFPIIPAKAGIQSIQALTNPLDSGFHRSDDFLRIYQVSSFEYRFYLRYLRGERFWKQF